MNNYEDTLNLPKTNFPLRANLPLKDKKFREYTTSNTYYKSLNNRVTTQNFAICDGPPYANGNIHIGHALNKSLKDIFIRSQAIQNNNIYFIPGWDCHGLPIEKSVKENNPNLSLLLHLSACRKYAQQQVEAQRNSMMSLNLIGDWDHPYHTMDNDFYAFAIRTLAKIVEQKSLYRSYRPISWCYKCTSSLADAELVYEHREVTSVYVKVPLTNFDSNKSTTYLLTWTTTPWTLPENKAFAVNKSLSYDVYYNNLTNEQIIVGQEFIMRPEYSKLYTILGSEIIGLTAISPLSKNPVKIYHGDFVTKVETGIVHVSPAHGNDDYNLAIVNNIPIKPMVDGYGRYLDNHYLLPGRHINEVTPEIIDLLGDLLYDYKIISHRVGTCWRHYTTVFYLTTYQWFIDLTKNNIAERRYKLINDLAFIPTIGKDILLKTISERTSWCISRQRSWGIPMGLFIHKIDGSMHPDTLIIMNKIADFIEVNGLEAYIIKDNYKDIVPDLEYYYQVTDTLDVWFDSGCVPFYLYHKHHKLFDCIFEGRDQYRGWFQSIVNLALFMNVKLPIKSIIAHGYVVDNEGNKLSKSKGNVIDPITITQKYGVDVLRLAMSSADYTKDINLSGEIIDNAIVKYRKVRNVIRFLLSLASAEPESLSLVLLSYDHYMLEVVEQHHQEIIEQYNRYNLQEVTNKIYHLAQKVSADYIALIRNRVYMVPKGCNAYKSAQYTSTIILKTILRCIAPILSVTAQEAYNYLNDDDTLDILSLYHITNKLHLDSLINPNTPPIDWLKCDNLVKFINDLPIMKDKDLTKGYVINPQKIINNLNFGELFMNNLIAINQENVLRDLLKCGQIELDNNLPTLIAELDSSLLKIKCPRCWKLNLARSDVIITDICQSCHNDLNNIDNRWIN